MNCSAAQRCLFELERPSQPSDAVRAHLASCADCRAYQRRIVELERSVAQLPVPDSSAARSAFVRKLREEGFEPWRPELISFEAAKPSPRWQVRERGKRKLAMASALAAGLVLLAMGVWAWKHLEPEPAVKKKTPSLDEMWALLKIPRPATDEARVQVLGVAAEGLFDESRKQCQQSNTAKLEEVADLLVLVVATGLPEEAESVSPGSRETVLKPIMGQLLTMEEKAKVIAGTVPDACAPSFRKIVEAAQEGRLKLGKLADGA